MFFDFSFLASYISFFLAIGQVFKLKHRRNRIVFAVFVSLGYFQFTLGLKMSGLMKQYPLLYGTDTPATLFMVVYMFYYVRHFLDESYRLAWWHLVAGVIFLISILGINTVGAGNEPGDIYSFWYGDMKQSGYYFALAMFTWVQNLFYYNASVYYLYRSFDFKKFYSNPLFYIGLCFIFATFIVFGSFTSYIRGEQVIQKIAWIGVSLISTIVYFLAIIFPSLVGESNDLGRFASPEKKYGKLKLDDDLTGQYLQKIEHQMQKEKAYSDSDLGLKSFAELVDIPAHYVSQVVNRQMNKTFSNYLNECRVEAAKKALRDPAKKDLSVLRIAYEVGFSSKASFNKIFKKHTGQTPSSFRA